MQMQCPDGVKSINIQGVEYTADQAGMVNIADPVHIDAAQRNGLVAVVASAPQE